jgi:hypothetical protein
MTYSHDRYQSHCQFCFQIFEGDSAEEAIRMAEKHEQGCEKANYRLPEPA